MNAIRTIHKSLLAGLACFLLSIPLSWGQSLEEDADYQKMLALQDQANAALSEGDYDKAYQLSQEGNQTSSILYNRFLAKKALKEAEKKLALAKSYKGDINNPDIFNQATDDYKNASDAYDKQEYPTTMELSQKIVAALDEIMPALIAAANTASTTKPTVTTDTQDATALPRYYKVRLIPENRDCFWKIAAYPFIYYKGQYWRKLYEANKHKIPDLNNPDLILPGVIFEIPSIKGEKREGTYDPQKKYPTFKSR